jgi:NAD(P)-dependent dehydrogenase (short-subunit alcohol dehydrogenase family)
VSPQAAGARSPFDLAGKVALVTGSSGGLGEATARVLAEQGAHVIVSSRRQDACEAVAQSMRERGLSVQARACHIGRLEDIDAMCEHLRQAHGRLDILVNNAVLSPWRSIEDTDPALFAKAVDVNLRGYWYLSAGAAKLMKAGGGSIVNVASVAALHPDRMLSLYSTLKTALIGMSRAFALEYGAFGIRANTILPGLFLTRLADAYDEDARRRVLAKTALGRFGDPDEIGWAVAYLSSRAGAFVTGASLVIDGGLSIAVM